MICKKKVLSHVSYFPYEIIGLSESGSLPEVLMTKTLLQIYTKSKSNTRLNSVTILSALDSTVGPLC